LFFQDIKNYPTDTISQTNCFLDSTLKTFWCKRVYFKTKSRCFPRNVNEVLTKYFLFENPLDGLTTLNSTKGQCQVLLRLKSQFKTKRNESGTIFLNTSICNLLWFFKQNVRLLLRWRQTGVICCLCFFCAQYFCRIHYNFAINVKNMIYKLHFGLISKY